MPARFDKCPDSLTYDKEDEVWMRHSGDVCADEKDDGADEEADGLVQDELGQYVLPYHIWTDVEPSLLS